MAYIKKEFISGAKLFEEYESGKTLRQLADRYSYSRTGIRQKLIEYDSLRWMKVRRNRADITFANSGLAAKIFAAYESGYTLKDMMPQFGHSYTYLRQIMILADSERYHKLKKRKSGPEKKYKKRNEHTRTKENGAELTRFFVFFLRRLSSLRLLRTLSFCC